MSESTGAATAEVTNTEVNNQGQSNSETPEEYQRNSKAYRRGGSPDTGVLNPREARAQAKGESESPKAEARDEDSEEGETPGQKKEAARKHKLKVDGEEIEVDDEELKKGYAHKKAASKVYQEGKRMMLEAQKVIQTFEGLKSKDNLFQAITQLGHDPKALVSEYLRANGNDPVLVEAMNETLGKWLTQKTRDPKEVELEETKAKLARYEEGEKKKAEQEQQDLEKRMTEKFEKHYEKEILSGLESSSLPKTKDSIKRMAYHIRMAARAGEPISGKEAAALVVEDLIAENTSIIRTADGETLLKLLGDDVAAKILTARGAGVKDPESQLRTPQNQETREPRPRKSSQPMTHAEWRRHNRG